MDRPNDTDNDTDSYAYKQLYHLVMLTTKCLWPVQPVGIGIWTVTLMI